MIWILIFWFLSSVNFLLEVLSYSQSFQEQVATFSSVYSEYSCTWTYFNIFLSIIYLIWCMVRQTLLLSLYVTSQKNRYKVIRCTKFYKTRFEELRLLFTRKSNFNSHVYIIQKFQKHLPLRGRGRECFIL